MLGPGHRWLVERSDRRSLAFVATTLVLLILPLFMAPPGWLILPWLVASTLFCFSACIINHNHVHVPVFRQAPLNHLFGMLLTFARGHTSHGVIVAHNFNHHVYTGREGDWIATKLAGEGKGAGRLLRYILSATLSMARGRHDPQSPRLTCVQQRQLRLERVALVGFVTVLLYNTGAAFLLYVFLPWLLAIMMLVGVNLLQHDGCDPESRFDHSRNFLGRIGNWFFFNNGYHAIHHLEPGLHWSCLPGAHAREVDGYADPALQCPSILGFLWRNYIFPGGRLADTGIVGQLHGKG